MSLKIVQIPVLSDNYVYLLRDHDADLTFMVDAAIEYPIMRALDDRGWTLDGILNTHHHYDHVGANLALKEQYGCTIYGPSYDAARIPGIDVTLSEGDTVKLGNHEAHVLFVPGHTRGHICFWFEEDRALFIGDTLFPMGCGRLFEGTPEEMWDSLGKLSDMPDDTRVYCAHEYTKANGQFALTVEPENPALKLRMKEVIAKREAGEPTVPSTLGEERATNPFLRAGEPELKAALGMEDAPDVEVFAHVRAAKDQF